MKMTHGTLKITKSHLVGTDYQAAETGVLDRLNYNSAVYRDLPAAV